MIKWFLNLFVKKKEASIVLGLRNGDPRQGLHVVGFDVDNVIAKYEFLLRETGQNYYVINISVRVNDKADNKEELRLMGLLTETKLKIERERLEKAELESEIKS